MQVKTVHGYDEFKKAVSSYNGVDRLSIYFTGEKTEGGKSWCPDCNEAEPHVMKIANGINQMNQTLLIVDVGNRTFWKDMHNPFRMDPSTRLMVIPTLLRWKSVIRLDGDYCAKPELIEMFFTEEE